MSDTLEELQGQLYLDQDVPVQLDGMLRARGLDVLATREAGNLGAYDLAQLAYAMATGRALVTHNRIDFEALHVLELEAGRTLPGILIALQRRELHVTRDRILDLLNRLDREQLRGGLFYV